MLGDDGAGCSKISLQRAQLQWVESIGICWILCWPSPSQSKDAAWRISPRGCCGHSFSFPPWHVVIPGVKEMVGHVGGFPTKVATLVCYQMLELCPPLPLSKHGRNTSRPWVEEGNLQQEVTAMMIFFSFLLSCIPVLEQTTGSGFPNYHPFGMSSVSSSSRRLSPTWEVLTAQQWSRSRSGIHLHNLAMVLLFSPGQGHMDWGTIWLPVARAGMEATVTLAISSFSAKASTILRSLVLVWHQFLSRFEHFKNNDAQFDQLCELQDLYCTIALWLLLWSPEWCVPLKCNVSILSASVGSRCVSHVVCSSQKNAQSVTESLQLQRLPSLLLQSID